ARHLKGGNARFLLRPNGCRDGKDDYVNGRTHGDCWNETVRGHHGHAIGFDTGRLSHGVGRGSGAGFGQPTRAEKKTIMKGSTGGEVQISEERDIVSARRAVREAASHLGFG